jgi:tRNA A37 methylthiotransferase MiaB
MRRDYTPREYGGVVSMIRSRMPEAAITTDIIAGFPGETEAEFAESYDFCAALNFARLHVFTYSPRPGTTAAGMPD